MYLEHQTGVTVVQAFKKETGGRCGCGFRQALASPRTWIFWTASDSRTPTAVLKTSTSSCQLHPYGLKVTPCNYATISLPKQSLLNKHPYFLPVPILILTNNLHNTVVFAYICLPHFVVRQNTVQVFFIFLSLGSSFILSK